MRQQFRALSRDLFYDFECGCPDPKWADSAVADIMKTRIKISGYADDNFFDNVNREPREAACRNCGRRFQAQWFRDGVEVEWLDPPA